MSQRMLRGIRDRAERLASRRLETGRGIGAGKERSFGIGCGAASGSRWRGCAATGRRLRCQVGVSSARGRLRHRLADPDRGALGRLLGGDAPVILVWDNLPAHTSLAMRAWAADQHAWLTVEYLPAYAPDLNPVEGLWANLKGVELANRACGSLEELAAAAEQGIGRVRGESDLLFSFLHQAGLSL